MSIDPLNTNLFTAASNKVALGSCAHVEDNFLWDEPADCFAPNQAAPLGAFDYSWGMLTGDLSQFIGDDRVDFRLNLAGNAYGHCDNDDYGDQCWVQFATKWNFKFDLNYVYEPFAPGGGADGGGNTGGGGGEGATAVAEPTGLGLMSLACLGFAALRRLRQLGVA